MKHAIIRNHAARHRLRTFVETGTYRGGTVAAVQDRFDRIYSIEIDERLYAEAARRFRGCPHITILHGDSGDVLPAVLERVETPALFWLDGHYSGPGTSKGALATPIRREIAAIWAHHVRGHVILIDDARGFGALPDYPTLDDLRALVRGHAVFEVRDDIVRIH